MTVVISPIVKPIVRRKQRIRGEDGAAAVEFALISTVLFMLLFGILEFGQFYSQYQAFQGAAREGARMAAVRGGTGVGPEAADVVARIREAAEPFTVEPDRSGFVISVEGGGSQCVAATVGQPVTVKWRQIVDIQLPFVPAIDTRTWISAVFKCE